MPLAAADAATEGTTFAKVKPPSGRRSGINRVTQSQGSVEDQVSTGGSGKKIFCTYLDKWRKILA